MIKVTLYTPSLSHMVEAFKPGDQPVILFVDTAKLAADMKKHDHYYENAAKFAAHKDNLKKGLLEAPIVFPNGAELGWAEGFHQVRVALDAGLPVMPVMTTAPLATKVKTLVGAENAAQHTVLFDMSDCAHLPIHY
jgi:hypothetical protein